MSWSKDIREWCTRNGHDPEVQENVLKNKGWDPSKYQPSMKTALYDYLKQWNTLAVKKLPTPATSTRKNPTQKKSKKFLKKKFTALPSGWKIWTFKGSHKYTTVATNGEKFMEFNGLLYPAATDIHLDLSRRLV